MKKSIYLLLGSAVIVTVLILTERNKRGEPSDNLTRVEMANITDAVQLYWLSHATWPPALLGSNNVSLYESLTSTNQEKRLLPERARWDEQKKLIDQWGNEYRFEAAMATNTDGSELCQLRVWSCGPAGKGQSNSDEAIELVRKWPKKL